MNKHVSKLLLKQFYENSRSGITCKITKILLNNKDFSNFFLILPWSDPVLIYFCNNPEILMNRQRFYESGVMAGIGPFASNANGPHCLSLDDFFHVFYYKLLHFLHQNYIAAYYFILLGSFYYYNVITP